MNFNSFMRKINGEENETSVSSETRSGPEHLSRIVEHLRESGHTYFGMETRPEYQDEIVTLFNYGRMSVRGRTSLFPEVGLYGYSARRAIYTAGRHFEQGIRYSSGEQQEGLPTTSPEPIRSGHAWASTSGNAWLYERDAILREYSNTVGRTSPQTQSRTEPSGAASERYADLYATIQRYQLDGTLRSSSDTEEEGVPRLRNERSSSGGGGEDPRQPE